MNATYDRYDRFLKTFVANTNVFFMYICIYGYLKYLSYLSYFSVSRG